MKAIAGKQGRLGAILMLVAVAGCGTPLSSYDVGIRAIEADRQIAEELLVELDSLRTAHRIPGMAVGILRDTSIILLRGLGYAHIAESTPVTPQTPFNIASVTKTMAGVVALRLVERGQLDLDQPMTNYHGFREFCADARAAGGIFFRDYLCDSERLTLRHVLSMTANGIPGTRFFYNPPSFSWASRPMAEVSGTSFSSLVDSLVFKPAGMRSSARIHRRLPLRPDLAARLAKPYHTDSTGHFVESAPPGPQGDGAAGGVISTAEDLVRFDVALSQGSLLSAESRRLMWSVGRAPTGAVLPYGLGWYVEELDGETLLWHSGLWEGAYSALYLKLPGRRVTMILLANSDGLTWDRGLDEAAVVRSPFAAAMLSAFRP